MPVQPVQLSRFYNPYWPDTTAGLWMTTDNNNSIAGLTAGISFVNGVHPLNTTELEQILRIDGNQNHGLTLNAATNGGTSTYTKPDSTHQWAMRESQVIRFRAAKNLPSSQAFLFGSSRTATPNAFGLWLNTDGTLTLKVYDNSSTEVDFTSLNTVAFDDSWNQWEVWCILTDTAFVNLPTAYWVVRQISSITSSRTATIFCTGNATDMPSRSFTMNMVLGEPTTRGAGFEWDVCNIFGAIEDAGSPYGIIRGDMMYPTGNGLLQEFSGGINYQNVDEMGDATLANRVPNDGTDFDITVHASGGAAQRNTYIMSNPVYAATGDSVASVAFGTRINGTAAGKGFSASDQMVYDDGTTATNGFGLNVATTYNSGLGYLSSKSGGSSGWSVADLSALEAGAGVITSDFAQTMRLSTVQAIAAFQASGETTPPLPLPTTRQRILEINQAVNRAAVI